MSTFFVDCLERDGVKFTSKSGRNWSAHCFNPQHDDRNASLSVEVTQGFFRCFGCKIQGNTYQYLTEYRGMKPSDAIQMMQDAGVWTGDAKKDYGESRQRDDGSLAAKVDEVPPKMRGLRKIDEYDYRDDDFRLRLKVVRYSELVDGKPKKSFMQLTPAKEGGYYMCNPTNKDRLPEGLAIEKIPLYRLSEVDREGDIIFVEGEKCADAVNDVPIAAGSPQPIGVCIAGGSNGVLKKNDFSPLFKRNVVVVADADDAGREFAKKVGWYLDKHYECNIRYVMPEGKDGYDIADALYDGGWNNALEWIKNSPRYLHPIEDAPQVEDKPSLIEEATTDVAMVKEGENYADRDEVLYNNEHFRVIGFNPPGTDIAFYIKHNNTTVWYKPTHLTSRGVLIHLAADMEFWDSFSKTGRLKPHEYNEIAAIMVKNAKSKGIVKQVNLLGRGACIVGEGEYIYHLGDRYLCDPLNGVFTATKSLEEVPGKVILEPGERISIVRDFSMARQYAKDFYRAMVAYRFNTLSDARIFMGWMVSSLVGGALEHRPHVWLSAPARTGKTFLIKKVLHPFFDDMFYSTADTTAAGIAQTVRSDSLGVVIDEFEPEENKEGSMRDVLAMMRAATGGLAARLRGSSEGRAVASQPRFSAMPSSIVKPILREADESRLVTCRLSTTPVKDWPSVRDAIYEATKPHKMAAIRSAIVHETPKIIQKVNMMEADLEITSEMDTRSIQIHSALTAGVEWLSGDSAITYRAEEDNIEAGGHAILQAILTSTQRILGTVKEDMICSMLYKIHNNEYGTDREMRTHVLDTLCYLGLKISTDVYSNVMALLVARNMPGMSELIKRSPLPNINLSSLSESLKQIDGAYIPKTTNGQDSQPYFGRVRKRAIAIPFSVLKDMGFKIDEETETAAIDAITDSQYETNQIEKRNEEEDPFLI